MRRRRTIALFAALSMAVMACSSGGGASQAPASAAPSGEVFVKLGLAIKAASP